MRLGFRGQGPGFRASGFGLRVEPYTVAFMWGSVFNGVGVGFRVQD